MVYNVENGGEMKCGVDDKFWNIVQQFIGNEHVKESIELIKKCYKTYKPEDVFLSFNGGKDCTVLLYLTMYTLKSTIPKYNAPIVCLYIQPPSPFKEIEHFIQQCKKLFNLEILTYNCGVKEGLAKILQAKPNLKACLMGTRRTDPYSSHLNHFQITDPDWPQVMRVSPILDWKYSEVWKFLLSTKTSYCELYDQGYTSLGSKCNTYPNPALKFVDETGVERYHPAWRLEDESKERCGRARL